MLSIRCAIDDQEKCCLFYSFCYQKLLTMKNCIEIPPLCACNRDCYVTGGAYIVSATLIVKNFIFALIISSPITHSTLKNIQAD